MTLLDTHPYRFGWRIWYVLNRIGRLITPVECVMLAGHTLEARCANGHTPPVLACTCGVHYWPDIAITDAHNYHNPPLALTFGVALGPITPDRVDATALRSRRHRVLHVFVPSNLEPIINQVSQHHRVPVHAGISEAACRAAAINTLSNRGLDWLTALAAAASPEPDDATMRYNDAITSIRGTRRPLDAAAVDHIQAQFEACDTRRLIGGLQ